MSGTDSLFIAFILGGFFVLNIYGEFYWRRIRKARRDLSVKALKKIHKI